MVKLHLRPAIVLFGDSITQFSYGEAGVQVGWATLLSSAYQRRADLFNRGFSGYNTRHALELVPRVFGTHESGVLFCTVFFGSNDAALPGERQHVPLEEYSDNLGNIIRSIRELTRGSNDSKRSNNDFPIVIMTPPPVDNEAWKNELEIEDYDRTNEGARKYGLQAQEVAKTFDNCSVLDTWELLGGNTSKFSGYLCDGLHLSDSGNRLVYEGLMELIKREYPHLAPEECVDGEYQNGGMPVEEKLWGDLC
jgi:lysophospholipase L1-like esterase